MKHEIKLYRVSDDGKSAKPLSETLSVETVTLAKARAEVKRILIERGFHVRSINYAAEGGLIAYLLPKPPDTVTRPKRRAIR